jgi:fibronectin type 3 domain-containing protein
MKKSMITVIVILLFITACDNSTNIDVTSKPTLIIRNESSVKLYDVKWGNTFFGDFEPGDTRSKEVDAGSGYVFFFKGVKQSVNDTVVYNGINCRANEVVSVKTGENQFNFIDNTIVVDTDDTENRAGLGTIVQRITRLTIQNNSSVQITNVKFGNISFGDFSVGVSKTYGVTASTGYLYFTKAVNDLDCRINTPITIEDKEQINFIFNDDTPVVEIANVSNIQNLSEITRLGITGLVAGNITSTSTALSWNFTTGATGYNVYRSTSSTGTYTKQNTALITENSYIDTSVLSGTSYYYKASVVNSGGESDRSDFISVLTVPSAPGGINAEMSSSGIITLIWTSPGGVVSSYNIYRSDSPSGAYSKAGTSTQTSYTDNGLAVNTVYYYKVSALNASGESSQSDYTGSVPSIPKEVSASSVSSSSVSISWSIAVGAENYKTYRSTSADGTYSQVGTPASSPYTDTGLSSNTIYFYKVSAINSGGEGAKSTAVSVTTIPAVPTEVSSVASSPGSITVSWPVVSGVTTKVYRCDSSSGSYDQIGTSTGSSYTDTGLPVNTTYYYKVSAANSNGESGQSVAVFATTMPDIPSGISASTVSSSSLSLTWMPVSGAVNYRIYRTTSASGTYTRIEISISSPYTNTGLQAGTTYYYKVSAVNNAGVESPLSSSVSTITKPAVPSLASSAALSSSSIRVSWYSEYGAQGYRIYRSTSASGTYNQIGTSTSSPYDDTGLQANTTYYYKVSAFNNGGESDLSDFVSVKTNLAAPTGLAATTTSANNINLSWNAVTGAVSYTVLQPYTGTMGTIIWSGTARSLNITGNTTNNTYAFSVIASGANGERGDQSDYVTSSLWH